MNILSALFLVNKQLLDFLNQGFPINGRDEYITKINEFLDEREILIVKLKESKFIFTKSEMFQINFSNKEIDKLLSQYLQVIKNDIKRINQSKEKNKMYSDPYESVSFDGTFVDKRQ